MRDWQARLKTKAGQPVEVDFANQRVFGGEGDDFCGDSVCEPGSVVCAGLEEGVMRCDDFGASALFDACDDGDVCVDDSCQTPICEPNTSECNGNTVLTCNADGLSTTGMQCSDGFMCTAGACVEETCIPECGSRVCGVDPVCGTPCGTCDNNETCSANGTCDMSDLSCNAHDDCNGWICDNAGMCDDYVTCEMHTDCPAGAFCWDFFVNRICSVGCRASYECSGSDLCNNQGSCLASDDVLQQDEPCDITEGPLCEAGLICNFFTSTCRTSPF
ncbi:MAG: hypothetical protein GY822_04640 [Deltaproteobacteria bacterium]|nr:hypothetical protein [Deltaproteobacteria bacterium]